MFTDALSGKFRSVDNLVAMCDINEGRLKT
jgi:hypothetical protein